MDAPDYSPVEHLQALFPSVASLTQLEATKQYLALYASSLAVKQQHTTQLQDARGVNVDNLVTACDSVGSISEEIDELRLHAQKTSQDITTITQDIKKLDNTKANLIQTITMLKRLQMLTTAYNQLASLVAKRQYREMAQTLPAVLELAMHFRQFRSIDQIAKLSRQISDLQTKITDQIFNDFATAIERQGSDPDPKVDGSLADACIVLDSLESSSTERDRLIAWYCNVQLKEYRTIFSTNDEAGSIENISRRYGYLKRLLNTHGEEISHYFAPSWDVGNELCQRFCQTTREDIHSLFSQKNGMSATESEVQILLNALNETLEFEQYLDRKFKLPAKREDGTVRTYANSISSAFQPHLNIWIMHQDRILTSKFAQYRAPAPPSNDEDGDASSPTVLPSSADLFIFYRQLLTQTSKLSTGPPLLDLANLFGKWLHVYCTQVLRPLLPERLASEDDIRLICFALATADYCFTTTTQLEDRLVEQIDADLKEKVTLESVKNMFLETINMCISSLVAKVESSCDFAWREMANTNWAKLETVGDQSGYVNELTTNVERNTRTILAFMAKELYCRMLCDKVVEVISNDFLKNVVRVRPISEVAAEQMLLDLYVVKGCFLNLPLLRPAENDNASGDSASLQAGRDEHSDAPQVSQAYTRHVNKCLGRVETIFKVILTQSEPSEGLIQNYFFLIGDKSAENFGKILELKGVPRSQHSRLLEVFYSHLKAHDNLVEDSPLLKNLSLRPTTSSTPTMTSGLGSRQASGPFLQNGSSNPLAFEPKLLGSSLLSKEGLERFAHGAEAPVNKFSENFRNNIGRLFRRDGGTRSPVGRN